VWVSKTPYAQPIPLVNHSKNIPAIKTPVPGVYFASMSQVSPGTGAQILRWKLGAVQRE